MCKRLQCKPAFRVRKRERRQKAQNVSLRAVNEESALAAGFDKWGRRDLELHADHQADRPEFAHKRAAG